MRAHKGGREGIREAKSMAGLHKPPHPFHGCSAIESDESSVPSKHPKTFLEALHLSVWGGRRYVMLVQLEADRMTEWAECMEQLCLRTLESNQGRSST